MANFNLILRSMKYIEHQQETTSEESIGYVKFDLDSKIKVIHSSITQTQAVFANILDEYYSLIENNI